MAITYLSGQRIQGLSEAGAVDGLGTAGLLNYNNGTYDASGKIGRCYSVSSTQYSSAASGAKSNFKFLHEPSCKWSIAFWLKVASSGSGIADGKIIMGTADGGTGEIGTCLKMNGSSALLLHIRGSSSYVARPSSNNGCIEEDGNWHHYVMTYDQTLADYNMKIWKDGSAFTIQSDGDKESDDNSTSDPAEYFTVGGGGIGSGFAFAIDEISTWSRVLSETEAEFLYDNNGGGTAQVTTNMSNLAGLKTYWNLNESTGNWANDASPTDEKSTVTDVPTGSQFEETDTRKFFQAYQSVATPDYDGSGTWATTGSQVTESSSVVSFDITTRTANHTVTKDLSTALSNTAWVMRCKLDFTTLSASGDSTTFLEVGMSSDSSSTAMSTTGGGDYIGLQLRELTGGAGHGWGLQNYNDEAVEMAEDPEFDTYATTSTTYYVEIKRLSSTSMSIGLYTDSNYDTLITGLPLETNSSISSSITGLQYIRIGNATHGSQSNTQTIEGTVQDIQIWNNVTTPPPATAWKERGTAI